jgi:folate-binding protein YgfZ
VERDGTILVAVSWGGLGFDLITPEEAEVDAISVSDEDLEPLRIAAGRPRFGIDFDASTHIAATPVIARAVSFTKGCYPGQESVARVQNLGRVRKRLVGLSFDGTAVPAPGTTLTAEGMDVGRVTSTAEWDGRVAGIGVVRSDVHDGATVEAGASAATVRAL